MACANESTIITPFGDFTVTPHVVNGLLGLLGVYYGIRLLKKQRDYLYEIANRNMLKAEELFALQQGIRGYDPQIFEQINSLYAHTPLSCGRSFGATAAWSRATQMVELRKHSRMAGQTGLLMRFTYDAVEYAGRRVMIPAGADPARERLRQLYHERVRIGGIIDSVVRSAQSFQNPIATVGGSSIDHHMDLMAVGMRSVQSGAAGFGVSMGQVSGINRARSQGFI